MRLGKDNIVHGRVICHVHGRGTCHVHGRGICHVHGRGTCHVHGDKVRRHMPCAESVQSKTTVANMTVREYSEYSRVAQTQS